MIRQMEVIAQLNKKFVLALVDGTMWAIASACLPQSHSPFCSVAVDQHAADERCRLEMLTANLIAKSGSPVNLSVHTLASPSRFRGKHCHGGLG